MATDGSSYNNRPEGGRTSIARQKLEKAKLQGGARR